MKNYFVWGFLLLFVIQGCSKPREIRQERLFANENWQKFDTLRFSVEGLQAELPRDLNLIVRFNALYQTKALPVTILIQSPDGAESVIEKTIWLRNPDETPRGIRHGTVSWDYTYCFREAYEFSQTGTYRILIDSKTGKFDNYGIEKVVFEAIPVANREPVEGAQQGD